MLTIPACCSLKSVAKNGEGDDAQQEDFQSLGQI